MEIRKAPVLIDGLKMKRATKWYLVVLTAFAVSGHAFAEPPTKVEDDYGSLNPDDTGREMLIRKIEMGARDTVTCSLAFNTSKYDDHARARYVATVCAQAGNSKAMTWISHLDANGIGGPRDPQSAARWDLRAAETGDPVGQFNYGLNLLRGFGVPQDTALGRTYVDRAADQGLEIAVRLRRSNYDLNEVTPDVETSNGHGGT